MRSRIFRRRDIIWLPGFPILCPTIPEPFVTAQQYLDVAGFQPGQIVLDLGAYCGLTAICFSKEVGASGRVISVEPDPANFEAATKNIRLHERIHGLRNVTLVAKAVSAQAGKLRFSGEGTMGSSALSIVGLGRGDDIFVDTISLTALARSYDLERVDFIKMDIEGSEDGLLKGSSDFFDVFQPRMIIEPHVVGGVLVADSVMSTLQGYGYACRTLEQFGASLPLIVAEPSS